MRRMLGHARRARWHALAVFFAACSAALSTECTVFNDKIATLVEGDDAASDAAHSDAASAGDASSDGGGDGGGDANDGGDAAGPFCAGPPATFCDDFDGHSVNALWTSFSQSPGARVVADDGGFVSPPSSYQAGVPAADAGLYAYLRKDVGSTPSWVRVSFDVLIESGDAVNLGNLVVVRFGPGTSQDSTLAVYSGRTALHHIEEADPTSGTTSHSLVANLPGAGQWTRLFVEVSMKTTPYTFTISSGAPGSRTPGTVLLAASQLRNTFAMGALGLRLGLVYAQPPETGWSVRYDNLLVETQ